MLEKPYRFVKIAKEICRKHGFLYISEKGMGVFKETYHIQDPEKICFALKILDPKKVDVDRLVKEIEALKKCDSPFISKLYHFNKIKLDKVLYFYAVEEYLDGGTLSEKLQDSLIQIEEIKNIAICITRAIKCLKRENLVHRDIKPDNIMFKKGDNTPILVDLGLVRDLSASSLTQSWILRGPGTPFFSSPEQLNNEKHLIDWKTDQFSLGVVIALCLTDKHPYGIPEMSSQNIVSRVAERHGVQSWFKEKMENTDFNFVLKMLEPWPVRRYNNIDKMLSDLNR